MAGFTGGWIDRVDPATGKTQVPALMLDELITDSSKKAGGETSTASTIAGVPEEEDQEYALIAKQMESFKTQHSDLANIADLAIPLLAGPEVITCDNSQMTSAGDDKGRSGLVFSVPIYGVDKKAKENAIVKSFFSARRFTGLLSDALSMARGWR